MEEEESVPRSPTWPRRWAGAPELRGCNRNGIRRRDGHKTRYKKWNVIKNIFGETRQIYETFGEARAGRQADELGQGTLGVGR